MTAPTDCQVGVLAFIHRFTSKRGYPPTLDDMCEHFSWASKHTAHCHVAALVKKGLAEKEARIARSLKLTTQGQKWVRS